MSAFDRYKAIEQLKKMMDIKTNNDQKQVNENRSQQSQIKDILEMLPTNESDPKCKLSISAFL